MESNYKIKYNQWLNSEFIDEDSKQELDKISEEEIEDRFHKDLEFGTGGLRGIMGSGTNRLNKYTVGKATQGLANYLNKKYKKDISVAIAYDSRNNSKEFAKIAAKVLTNNDIKVYMFSNVTPTPMLSFAVRSFKCNGGIVITASHNPKEYNGYKVYDCNGTQVTDNTAKGILEEISAIEGFDKIKGIAEDGKLQEEYFENIENSFLNSYLKKVKDLSLRKDILENHSKNLTIVYTPLHGSGITPIKKLMNDLKYNFIVVKEQEKPDGNFPTVSYPNPEEPKVFELAKQIAKKENADIIMATDPDCDRIGIMIKDENNEYEILTGNEVGILLSYYILTSLKEKNMLTNDSMIIKTIVSTDMIKKFEEDFKFKVIEVLTGFKYIGELIEETKDKKFLFGFEESYGYLMGDFVRDKDAVIAAAIIAEMSLYYKTIGISLHEQLENIYREYGYNKEKLLSFEFKGIKGKNKIDSIINMFRNEFKDIVRRNNRVVKIVEDYELGIKKDYKENTEEKLNLPKSKVLKFILDDGSWIVVRPSGTEPKIKFYISTNGKNTEECLVKINDFEQTIKNIID
ncbi:MAG: phospho-sugar mutase [Clostridium sp.]